MKKKIIEGAISLLLWALVALGVSLAIAGAKSIFLGHGFDGVDFVASAIISVCVLVEAWNYSVKPVYNIGEATLVVDNRFGKKALISLHRDYRQKISKLEDRIKELKAAAEEKQ